MNGNGHDLRAIAEAVQLIVGPGQVTELRALAAVMARNGRPCTVSGYFNDPDKLAKAVSDISTAKGIYFIPNPVDPSLMARASNRLRAAPRGGSTQDQNIVRRRWLLIDTDAERQSGISATDDEHKAAIDRARAIHRNLEAEGWPEPIVADSGNGAHLLYQIDLPRDDRGLVQRCLAALARQFDDHAVKIDQTVFNPARIWKVYGTMARKGDSTPERPHRMAMILSKPATLSLVPMSKLEVLATEGNSADDEPAPRRVPEDNCRGFDVEAFIERHKLDAVAPRPWNGQQGPGRIWVLNTDPMHGVHNDGSCFIAQHAGGAISAGCHHNSADWNWKDLKSKYEPDSKAHGCSSGKRSQSSLLVELAEGVELFHTPGGHYSEGFASITINGHRETWPVKAKGFRQWLAKLHYDTHGKVPGSQALKDALNVIAGKAVYGGPE